MVIRKRYLIIYLILTIISSNSCIDETIIGNETASVTITEKLLQHVEANGNYISSNEYPALISADDLQANLQSYLVIDVRSDDEFNSGHIPGSVNINNEELFDFVDQRKDQQIILVSQTGQAASYYTTLFRVYGIENIFALRFGIAVWNIDFSSTWINNAENKLDVDDEGFEFNNIQYPKNDYSQLPNLTGIDASLSTEEILKIRVQSLIEEGFNDNILGGITSKTIDFDKQFEFDNRYLVCFGGESLYGLTPNVDPEQKGHTPGTVFYLAIPPDRSNLKSISFLQTFPNDRPILIYSFSGHLSAKATAYLSILGYNARSVLFGGHNIFFPRMTYYKGFFDFYVFGTSEIRNYNYD